MDSEQKNRCKGESFQDCSFGWVSKESQPQNTELGSLYKYLLGFIFCLSKDNWRFKLVTGYVLKAIFFIIIARFEIRNSKVI